MPSPSQKQFWNNLSLYAATRWIMAAQLENGGVSKAYHLNPYCPECEALDSEAYKEVTGYIIPTIIALSKANIIKDKSERKNLMGRAIAMGDWLVEVQDEDGKWDYVFDTGQVLFGLVALYKETKNEKYLDALIKGADYLVEIQEPDGNWCVGEFAQGLKAKVKRALLLHGHSQNTRTAWALLKVWELTKIELYKTSAIKNLDWALNQQRNGFYQGCHGQTHFQLYTAQGFLESGLILRDYEDEKYNAERYIHSAEIFVENIYQVLSKEPFLFEKYTSKWKPAVKYSALTSNCQLAILLHRISKLYKPKGCLMFDKSADYRSLAQACINYAKSGQNLDTPDCGIWGGIPGSVNPHAGYEKNKILPWATKFFIDAILLSEYNVEVEG